MLTPSQYIAYILKTVQCVEACPSATESRRQIKSDNDGGADGPRGRPNTGNNIDDEENNEMPSIATLHTRINMLCSVLEIDSTLVVTDRVSAGKIAESVSSCWCATFARVQLDHPAPKTCFFYPTWANS